MKALVAPALVLHVAAANFNLPDLIGTPPPEGFCVKGCATPR